MEKYIIVEIINDMTDFRLEPKPIYRIKKRNWLGKYKFLKCKRCNNYPIAYVTSDDNKTFKVDSLEEAKKFKEWLMCGGDVLYSNSLHEFVFAKFLKSNNYVKHYKTDGDPNKLDGVQYYERIVG